MISDDDYWCLASAAALAGGQSPKRAADCATRMLEYLHARSADQKTPGDKAAFHDGYQQGAEAAFDAGYAAGASGADKVTEWTIFGGMLGVK